MAHYYRCLWIRVGVEKYYGEITSTGFNHSNNLQMSPLSFLVLKCFYFILVVSVEYQCDSCDFVAMTAKGLTIHSKVHKKSTFPCPLCQSSDDTYDDKMLAFHLQDSHNLINQLFCAECGWLVNDQQTLTSHMTEEHNHPEAVYYVCYVCGVASDTKDAAKAHLEKHTDEDIQACLESKGVKKPDCAGNLSFCFYRC